MFGAKNDFIIFDAKNGKFTLDSNIACHVTVLERYKNFKSVVYKFGLQFVPLQFCCLHELSSQNCQHILKL